MRHIVVSVAWIFLSIPSANWAKPENVLAWKEAATPIRIDGEFSDWNQLGSLDTYYLEEREGLQANFQIFTDQEALYFAVTVTDPESVKPRA